MDTLFCPNCRAEKEYVTEVKSNQNTARCFDCNTFIKNIPYNKPKMYVGKYKDKNIDEIDDLKYLDWAHRDMTSLNKRTKDAIAAQISKLKWIAQ